MVYASYQIRRVVWPIYRWTARRADGASATGLSISWRKARWTARSWLRAQKQQEGATAVATAVGAPEAPIAAGPAGPAEQAPDVAAP